MSADDMVTQWIGGLQSGDSEAAGKLWDRYITRLLQLARKKLQGISTRVGDEEDIALSAFNSFCMGVSSGKFPDLSSRENLWALLVLITARKVFRHVEYHTRKKRGGGTVRGESVFSGDNLQSTFAGLDQMIGEGPTPEFAVQVAEETQRLLSQLNDENLRTIALLKMEGHTNEEIARKLGCTERTVRRKIELIRMEWSHESE